MSITLTNDQTNAIKSFAKFLKDPHEKFMIIQGAAGCGKSTLVEYLIKTLEAQFKMYALLLRKDTTKSEFEVNLTATTNKAAAVLKELTGRHTQTIHTLLKLKVTPNVSTGTVKLTTKDDYCMLHNKLIILDEASMLNDELFEILDNTVHNSKVVLIGDQYQLAPVRQAVPIMETLDCLKVTMNKIIRNKGAIMKAGQQFRHTVEDEIFKGIPFGPELLQLSGPDFQKVVENAFMDPGYNTSTAKILAWTNKRVLSYNDHIRKLKGYPTYFTAGEIVYTNKPIMAGANQWATDSRIEITCVGDLVERDEMEGRMIELDGRISMFLPESYDSAQFYLKQLAKQAKKTPRLWGKFFMLKEGWLDLRPAYASTVHKSQGATYDSVFIDLENIGRCNISSDVARMMYVSISRAAKQVYFYGELPLKYQG